MAKRRKQKRPFESTGSRSESRERYGSSFHQPGGAYAFFQNFGTRETIESIIIAVILALLFRTFEAEAFIIPTGSMAPALQGQHMDVICEQCGYEYRTGSSRDSSNEPVDARQSVKQTFCPICQFGMLMNRSNPDHHSFSGDRILVNKFVYDFRPPERFDVIVFKNPNNAKQNYIKRLVGLPGENLLIENGDVFNMVRDPARGAWQRQIIRKPPEKLKVMLQTVHDNRYRGEKLKRVNWPLRWQAWGKKNSAWQSIDADGHPVYLLESPADSMDWLTYRHVRPGKADWSEIEMNRLPAWVTTFKGQLIGDYYEYNDKVYRASAQRRERGEQSLGLHWVGDLAIDCDVSVESPQGVLALKLVEGGAEFVCEIDVATGRAVVRCSDSTVKFQHGEAGAETTTGQSPLQGPGRYRLLFAQADDQVALWVNNRLVPFDAPTFRRSSPVLPRWSPDRPGDAEPLGIGGRGLKCRVERIRVLRDIYYTAAITSNQIAAEFLSPHADPYSAAAQAQVGERMAILQNPELWSNPHTQELLMKGKGRTEPMFQLTDGQFFPMGDNSPASLDARVWDGPHYLEDEFLIGRAMFIYWPHSLNRPIPYFPNFRRMRFIK